MEIKCGEVFLNKTVPMLLRHHLKIVSERLKLVKHAQLEAKILKVRYCRFKNLPIYSISH